MLKKILLSCLVATVALTTPLSTLAAGKVKPKTVATPNQPTQDNNLSKAEQEELVKIIQDSVENANAPGEIIAGKYYPRGHDGLYGELVRNMGDLGAAKKAVKISIKGLGYNSSFRGYGEKGKQAEIDVIFEGVIIQRSRLVGVNYEQVRVGEDKQERTELHLILQLEKHEDGRWRIHRSRNTADDKYRKVTADVPQAPNPKISKRDQQVFIDLFKRHLETLNKKDLAGYLATLDPQAPLYKQAKADTAQLFQDYTLKYSIQSVKVLSIGSTEAVVQMVATVKKVRGGAFKDSKMTTTNVLRKVNGKWRIYDTEVNALEDLQAKK
jgi:ketosteroid isomerase-like protein